MSSVLAFPSSSPSVSPSPLPNQIQRFRALFSGREDAFGVSVLNGEIRDTGKHEADSHLEHRPLTEEDLRKHLAGVRGVGILPALRDPGEVVFYCRFGVIDIDEYVGFDVADLARRIAALDPNLVVHRSKSGGAHIYYRTRVEVTTASMRADLRRIADALGLPPDVEIFPSTIDESSGEYPGAWINLPYFGAARQAISAEGRELSFEEFLDYAEARVVELPTEPEEEPAPAPDPVAAAPKRARKNYENGSHEGNRFSYLKSDLARYLAGRHDLTVEQLLEYAKTVRDTQLDPRPPDNEWKAWNVRKLCARLVARESKKPGPAGDWRRDLLLTTTGKPKTLLANAITAFRSEPDLARANFRFDKFKQTIVSAAPPPWGSKPIEKWSEQDNRMSADCLQRKGVEVGLNTAMDAACAVATERAFDPLMDYLWSLRWDGVPRIDTWLSEYAGAVDGPYSRLVGKMFLISMVARGLRPGSKVDHMLILKGETGLKKSWLGSALVPREEWFTDQLSDIRNKDSKIDLQGYWLIESAELVSLSRADVEPIKAFLTIRCDKFRPPYGRVTEEFPRRTVFIGSTNEDVFLKDATGNRRFWPVTVGRIVDIAKIAADRDQLFAEAVARFENGERWWPEGEENLLTEAEQDDHFQEDAWTPKVLKWSDDPRPASAFGDQDAPDIDSTAYRVLPEEVLEHALRLPVGQWNQSAKNRIAAILKKNGFERSKVTIRGRRTYCYCRDEPGAQIEIDLPHAIVEPPPVVWQDDQLR